MSGQGNLTAIEPSDADLSRRRHILSEAIRLHQQDLLSSIRVYLWRFGVVTNRVALEQRAEEVMQETVLQALQHAGNYDPSRPARTWLLGVAINEIRHLRRALGAEQLVMPIADTVEARAAARGSDFSGLSEAEMFDLLYNGTGIAATRFTVEDILSVVDENDQKVLRLHFVDGLSGRELAAVLGVSEGCAYTCLSRAKARLRKAFLGRPK